MFYHRKLTTVPCSPQQSLVVDQGTLVLLLKQLGQKSDHKRMKLLLPRSCVPVEVATVLTGQLRQQRLREGVTERFQLSQEWQLGSRWKSRVYTLAFELPTLGIDAPPPAPPPHPRSVSLLQATDVPTARSVEREEQAPGGNFTQRWLQKSSLLQSHLAPVLCFGVFLWSIWDLSSLTRD